MNTSSISGVSLARGLVSAIHAQFRMTTSPIIFPMRLPVVIIQRVKKEIQLSYFPNPDFWLADRQPFIYVLRYILLFLDGHCFPLTPSWVILVAYKFSRATHTTCFDAIQSDYHQQLSGRLFAQALQHTSQCARDDIRGYSYKSIVDCKTSEPRS